jgi:hypothetical protein
MDQLRIFHDLSRLNSSAFFTESLEQEKQRQQKQEKQEQERQEEGGGKRLGNKRRHSKILSELESVTRKLIWRALSLVPRVENWW